MGESVGQSARRAAQYVRMSTEHQRYSIENQAEVIAAYAVEHDYELTCSYFDPGISGLTLKKRKGLQALLSDSLRSDRGFDAILVLDISRWGRFQDPDQAAYYEFLCREAGVEVVYCAEPFDNDGSMVANIVKHLKRMMAAEYSRELSEKVFRGHMRQARLGFYQGGKLIYGVRRLVIDASGRPRFCLERGDRKALHSDRVILVPGPAEEQRIIRRIFRAYVRQRKSILQITTDLNAADVPCIDGHEWTKHEVRSVLKSETAIGTYVYNRTSQKMARTRRSNPSEAWVRVPIMDPVVPVTVFRAAAERLKIRGNQPVEASAILDGLRRLLQERGHLSKPLIEECPYVPASSTVVRRFGSLRNAYQTIGYSQLAPRWTETNGCVATNGRLISLLRGLYDRSGPLTGAILDAELEVPGANVFKKRFGSLRAAYQLAGIPCTYSHAQITAYWRSVERGTNPVADISGRGGVVSRFSDEHLLNELRRLHARDGYVSSATVEAEPGLLSSSGFRGRFGSLLKAYELAGLAFERGEICRKARARYLATRH